IKNGNSQDIIDQIRHLPKDKGDELKVALSGVCFNGSFNYRKSSGLIKHSGLMVIDLDKFDAQKDAINCREDLKENPYIFSAWISPSGYGVKALVKIPADAETHKQRFTTFGEYINHPNWDSSGSD